MRILISIPLVHIFITYKSECIWTDQCTQCTQPWYWVAGSALACAVLLPSALSAAGFDVNLGHALIGAATGYGIAHYGATLTTHSRACCSTRTPFMLARSIAYF